MFVNWSKAIIAIYAQVNSIIEWTEMTPERALRATENRTEWRVTVCQSSDRGLLMITLQDKTS